MLLLLNRLTLDGHGCWFLRPFRGLLFRLLLANGGLQFRMFEEVSNKLVKLLLIGGDDRLTGLPLHLELQFLDSLAHHRKAFILCIKGYVPSLDS